MVVVEGVVRTAVSLAMAMPRQLVSPVWPPVSSRIESLILAIPCQQVPVDSDQATTEGADIEGQSRSWLSWLLMA